MTRAIHAAMKGTIGKFAATAVLGAVGLGMTGCHSDKPHDHGQRRPPVDELDARDRGLQSYDIQMAADRMAAELLASRRLNGSREQWTMVVDKMDDQTRDRRYMTNYQIFLEALRVRLQRQGEGRVQLITNLAKQRDIRSREIDGAGPAPSPQAINPDFALSGVVTDLPNRGTVYYQMNFDVLDLRKRTIEWSGSYEVKVDR
ncbi:MAG TPA: hypothetical protein VF796_25525 [Humisphaera sp.]